MATQNARKIVAAGTDDVVIHWHIDRITVRDAASGKQFTWVGAPEVRALTPSEQESVMKAVRVAQGHPAL